MLHVFLCLEPSSKHPRQYKLDPTHPSVVFDRVAGKPFFEHYVFGCRLSCPGVPGVVVGGRRPRRAHESFSVCLLQARCKNPSTGCQALSAPSSTAAAWMSRAHTPVPCRVLSLLLLRGPNSSRVRDKGQMQQRDGAVRDEPCVMPAAAALVAGVLPGS